MPALTVGRDFTTTVIFAVLVKQPTESVKVAVYVVVCVGRTIGV